MTCNPIKTDLEKFRALAYKLNEHLLILDIYLIRPLESLKRANGLSKIHEPDIPVRSIVSSVNSVTSGAEIFLKRLVQPILNQCNFSGNSTKEFKNRFEKDIRKHELVSYDAVSLYTSVNVSRTIEYIIKIRYEDPITFFRQMKKLLKSTKLKKQ